jgi:hypothetical protein
MLLLLYLGKENLHPVRRLGGALRPSGGFGKRKISYSYQDSIPRPSSL